MRFLQIILYPFSILYGLIMSVRNWFFRVGIYRTEKVEAKVVSVGNLSVGGTGKTPHVEYFARQLSEKQETAILLRGYGRKTKGFVLVDENSTFETVGDEALFYFQKLGNKVKIATCEKRVDGAKKLLELFPQIEVIVLDDAYQHRFIYRDFNVLLTEYHKPYFLDKVLPSGRLREFPKGERRADICIVTKSPEELSEVEKDSFKTKINLNPKDIYFSKIKYGQLINLQTLEEMTPTDNILLVTGIGNSTPLVNHLSRQSKVKHLEFKDHHSYTEQDLTEIHKLFDTFVGQGLIVTTEKDAMRILFSDLKEKIKKYPWCYQEITIHLDNEKLILDKLYGNIKED